MSRNHFARVFYDHFCLFFSMLEEVPISCSDRNEYHSKHDSEIPFVGFLTRILGNVSIENQPTRNLYVKINLKTSLIVNG